MGELILSVDASDSTELRKVWNGIDNGQVCRLSMVGCCICACKCAIMLFECHIFDSHCSITCPEHVLVGLLETVSNGSSHHNSVATDKTAAQETPHLLTQMQ
jgi:hypothetical protein